MNTFRNRLGDAGFQPAPGALARILAETGLVWESAPFPVALGKLAHALEMELGAEGILFDFAGTPDLPPLSVSTPAGHALEEAFGHDFRGRVRCTGRRAVWHRGASVGVCLPLPARAGAAGTLSVALAEDRGHSAIEVIEAVAGIAAAQWAAHRRHELARAACESEIASLRRMLGERTPVEGILGDSDAMDAVRERLVALARQDIPVLLSGEQGTGKDLAATALHLLGRGDSAPFRKVRFQSEPHKGSPPPGDLSRGLAGGTLYLEEIAHAPEPVWEWLAAGNTEGARLVASVTARTPEAPPLPDGVLAVFAGGMVSLPALRDRPGDIPALAGYFAELHLRGQDPNSDGSVRISTAALEQMLAYPWPGNVRELREAVASALDRSGDRVVHGRCLPPTLRAPETTESGHGATLTSSVHVLEKDLILDALERNHGNVAAAARLLGITPRMLRYRMEKLGIDPPQRPGRRQD
jgi:transcriptional regulator with AAA-type ATPase domain